jgi:hypothetical protein
MTDSIPPRVFDCVTAAVENSAQPAPPPYAEIQNPQLPVSGPEGEGQVPPPQKGAARKPAAKAGGVKVAAKPEAPSVTHVRASAGSAEGAGKASDTK